jgi:hypothetical protein
MDINYSAPVSSLKDYQACLTTTTFMCCSNPGQKNEDETNFFEFLEGFLFLSY